MTRARRRRGAIGGVVLGCAALGLVAAQERGTVVKPVPRVLTVTDYRIISLEMVFEPILSVTITYADNTGTTTEDVHVAGAAPGSGAAALISIVNQADHRSSSLERRLLEHLAEEGKIPAVTVTGKPR